MSTDTSTVWIVNEAGHNYSDAERFAGVHGDMRPLTIDSVNILRTDRLMDHLSKGIVKYSRPEDFLLISGSPVINALALAIWMNTHSQCKLLLWNAKSREYEVRTVTVEDIKGLADKQLIR